MSCRQGDWMCGACQHVNFQRRDMCQRCSCPKYAGSADLKAAAFGSAGVKQEAAVLAGDWYCGALNCGAHNYASRSSCYRCCSSRDYCGLGAGVMAASGYAVPGWKNGDWICSRYGCGMHNYASRMECLKCQVPRDFGGAI